MSAVFRRFRGHPALVPAVLALALAGCSGSPGGSGAVARVPEYTIQDFLGTMTYRGLSFSPGAGAILASSDASGIFNAVSIPVDGSSPTELTHSTTTGIYALSWFPDDERFLYTQDEGGNELNHLHVQDPSGKTVDLTPGDSLKAEFRGWSWDRERFLVATNERDRRYFDLYAYSAGDYARDRIYVNTEGYDFAAAGPDEETLALVKARTDHDSDVYLLDRRTGDRRNLTAHTGAVRNEAETFSPDGRSLFITTDAGREFRYLLRLDLGGGPPDTVLAPDGDVMGAQFDRSGTHLIVPVNRDARTVIRVFRWPGLEPVDLPALPRGNVTALTYSADGGRVAFYASDGRTPPDLYVMNAPGGKITQLTRSLSPGIDPQYLVAPEHVRFASFDGTEIPGLLYRPLTADPEHRVPALVWVHGGPGGQSRVGYSPLIQYLVNHGYLLYEINNRGSSGYGKTFYAMDDRRHGRADLDDVVASRRMLLDTHVVEPGKIGIGGGSYGGYMTLAALAFRPDSFAVGVDLFGVTNWVRTLESIPPWWTSEREALYAELGNPETDGKYLESISPLFHADRITKPLLVLQGANDPRVLRVESDEMVEAVKANGVPVTYIVFDDEGHGFRNKANRIEGYRAILVFLDQYLKGPGS